MRDTLSVIDNLLSKGRGTSVSFWNPPDGHNEFRYCVQCSTYPGDPDELHPGRERVKPIVVSGYGPTVSDALSDCAAKSS